MASFIQQPERDFLVELGFGRARGPNRELIEPVHKYGTLRNLTTSFQAVQTQGGAAIWPTADERVRIRAGGNAADTADGTGARSVEVYGINAAGYRDSEVIVTAGANASAYTTKTFWRIDRTRVVEVGVYGGTNAAIIEIENESAQLLAEVDFQGIGASTTLKAAYTTGINQTGLLTRVNYSLSSGKVADMHILTRENALQVTPPFSPEVKQKDFEGLNSVTNTIVREPYLELPPLTDIWVEMAVDQAGGEVSISLSIILSNTNTNV